ncbi:MAG: pseudouridine synthase, partial [Phycisphaerales bacterium]
MRAGAEPSIAAADGGRPGARAAVGVKPAGRSSAAPGAGRPGAPRTLIEQVRTLLGWPDAQLPHRLDRPTRGFVVVARDRAAVAEHNASIRAGAWTKRYLARVRPAPGIDPGALGRHARGRRHERAL